MNPVEGSKRYQDEAEIPKMTPVRAGVRAALEDRATAPQLRKLTVTVVIEAQTTDDSILAPLVVEALQEFISHPVNRAGGQQLENFGMSVKFESKAGLDVTWRAINAYYEHGKLIGVQGVDSSGRPIDTTQGRV
jgi:hypothetical protein